MRSQILFSRAWLCSETASRVITCIDCMVKHGLFATHCAGVELQGFSMRIHRSNELAAHLFVDGWNFFKVKAVLSRFRHVKATMQRGKGVFVFLKRIA